MRYLVVALAGALCVALVSFVSCKADPPTPLRAVQIQPAAPASPSPSSQPLDAPRDLADYASADTAAVRFVTEWCSRPLGDTNAAQTARNDVLDGQARAALSRQATDQATTYASRPTATLQKDREADAHGNPGFLVTEEVEETTNGVAATKQRHFELTMARQTDGRWLVDEARIS